MVRRAGEGGGRGSGDAARRPTSQRAGSPAGWASTAGVAEHRVLHGAALVEAADEGRGRRRHPHGPINPRPRGRRDHPDLHPRPPARPQRRPEPHGPPRPPRPGPLHRPGTGLTGLERAHRLPKAMLAHPIAPEPNPPSGAPSVGWGAGPQFGVPNHAAGLRAQIGHDAPCHPGLQSPGATGSGPPALGLPASRTPTGPAQRKRRHLRSTGSRTRPTLATPGPTRRPHRPRLIQPLWNCS